MPNPTPRPGTHHIPHVGMRIIKSALAVFLCFVVYLLRGEQGMPFYSAIAAILCMQPHVSNSVKVALNRTVGTLIGGAAGMLVLLFERSFLPPNAHGLQYLLVSACVIPLIYLTLVVKKPTASYITCVVFLSITVSHGADVNPYLFPLNRVLDTFIGILVSLGVNSFRLPHKKDKGLLLAPCLEGALCQPGEHNADPSAGLSAYTRIHLQRLLDQGACLTIATNASPGTLAGALGDTPLRLPAVVLGGAALYDVKQEAFLNCKTLSSTAQTEAAVVFAKQGVGFFFYATTHSVLHIYRVPTPGEQAPNPAEQAFIDAHKGDRHEHFVPVPPPKEARALCLLALTPKEKAQTLAGALRRRLQEIGLADRVSLRPANIDDCWAVTVRAADATLLNGVRCVQELCAAQHVAAFAAGSVFTQVGGEYAEPNGAALLLGVEKGFAVCTPPLQEQTFPSGVIPFSAKRRDCVVRRMKRLYFYPNRPRKKYK